MNYECKKIRKSEFKLFARERSVWVAEDLNLPLTSIELNEIFNQEKNTLRMSDYENAILNILNEISNKPLSDSKPNSFVIIFGVFLFFILIGAIIFICSNSCEGGGSSGGYTSGNTYDGGGGGSSGNNGGGGGDYLTFACYLIFVSLFFSF